MFSFSKETAPKKRKKGPGVPSTYGSFSKQGDPKCRRIILFFGDPQKGTPNSRNSPYIPLSRLNRTPPPDVAGLRTWRHGSSASSLRSSSFRFLFFVVFCRVYSYKGLSWNISRIHMCIYIHTYIHTYIHLYTYIGVKRGSHLAFTTQ